jgi:type IV pilus assembly protein PilW
MALALYRRQLLGAAEDSDPNGFSLIELLVAMVVAFVAIAAVYSVYAVQQRENRNQRLKLAAHQNLRGALVVLEQEIRMAGFDPQDSDLFGITDVRRYSVIGTGLDPQGQPSLFYTVDWNENGQLEPNEEYGLRIRDDRKLGRIYLTMSIGGSGRQRLAENIEAWGLAYAVDADRNGRPDTWQGGSHLIWAVDSDHDNLLDSHLDTNNNGKIDLFDDANGDQVISAADGAPLNPPISLDRIKAVRIWLLVVTEHPLQHHWDNLSLVVGDRILLPPNDGFQRRVMESIIECRNQ